MLYFGLGDADLRDLYPGSAWITFGEQIAQTTFTREDIVVLSEELVKGRAEMLQAIHHLRGCGARVLYVGWSGNETDAWKRQLAFLGIYDWLFVEAEINLEHIDRLITHPRSPQDVERYLEDLHLQPAPPLAVVSVYTEDESDEPMDALTHTLQELAGSEEEAERSVLERVSGHVGNAVRSVRDTVRRRRETPREPELRPSTAPDVKRFVWSAPHPVTVRLVGDSGVGKSFLAWNLAALCTAHEMPAAVIERDSPIAHWGDARGVPVMADIPKRGYRVHIVTGGLDMRVAEGNVHVVVTWPDPARSEKVALALWQGGGVEDCERWWIVNYGDDESALPDGIVLSDRVLVVPYEARQVGAIRMKTPLVLSDPRFADRLRPLVEHIQARFADQARSPRKEEQADVALV